MRIPFDEDGKAEKAMKEQGFWLHSPPAVTIMVNPGLQEGVQFEVMEGMYFPPGKLQIGKPINPEDYEDAISIAVKKGDCLLISMLWSKDAVLELLTQVIEVFLEIVPESGAEKIRDSFRKVFDNEEEK